MNKIEKLHLESIKSSNESFRLDEEDSSITDTIFLENKAASKSAEITKDIAIKFAVFCDEGFPSNCKEIMRKIDLSLEDRLKLIFEEFLKTLE